MICTAVHEGHDCDCSHEVECICGEVTPDPEHHTCLIIADHLEDE